MKKVILSFVLIVQGTYTDSLFFVKKGQHTAPLGRFLLTDKTYLTKTAVAQIKRPRSVEELRQIVKEADHPISIVGARYSQGGQTAYPDGIAIDMSRINKIIKLNVPQKRIIVQAGATWRSVQQFIDKYDLSVAVMQSYNDFSIGGSLSVNVHARDIRFGSLATTVESVHIMLADGSIVEADRQNNADLFAAVLGGYGLMGVIIDATLRLTTNDKLEQYIELLDMSDCEKLFHRIKTNENMVFYNTEVYPPHFSTGATLGWSMSDKPVTNTKRLQSDKKTDYIGSHVAELFTRYIPALHKLRPSLRNIKTTRQEVVWRNYEMSYSISQLALHLSLWTTMTLQEYFVPTDKLQDALAIIRHIVQRYKVNVLNLSVRYVPQDSTSLLPYARQDSFALVFYINLLNTPYYKKQACVWTQELIDGITNLGGTYYLPYLICATREQFYKAYPQWHEFLEVKRKYDPESKFKNMLMYQYA